MNLGGSNSDRYALHGASRLCFLGLDLVQLGCSLPPIRLDSCGVRNQPWHEHRASGGRFYLYVIPPRPLIQVMYTDNPSNVRRRNRRNLPQHRPRQDRLAIQPTPSNRRSKTLLRLRRIRPNAHRPLLVRLDILPLDPVYRSRIGRRMRDHGHFLHLLGCLQLLGRYVPSLRELSHCGAIVL